jgi:hypothetical protein
METREWHSFNYAQRRLDVPKGVLRKLIDCGAIKTVRVTKDKIRIREAELQKFEQPLNSSRMTK